MGELPGVDEVDLVTESQCRVDPDQVVVRGRFKGNLHGALQGLEPGPDTARLIGQRQGIGLLPLTDPTFIFGDIDTEGDFCYALFHNDLRILVGCEAGNSPTKAWDPLAVWQLDS